MVYFIQGVTTGLIKIGKTSNLRARFHGLQTDSPDKLIVLGVLPNEPDDAPFHRKFRDYREHGEWFSPSPELLAFIAALPPFDIKLPQHRILAAFAVPPPTDREKLAAEVLKHIPFAKQGSATQLAFMRLYAKLRGWKSWRDVPAFSEAATAPLPTSETHYAN